MRRLITYPLALALCCLPSLAAAQTRASVLGIEPVDAPAEVAERVAEALRAQVRQSAGMRLVPGKSLEEIKLVFGCVDEKPDCMARVGRSMGAAKLIWGTLKKSTAGYNITLKYLDVASASVEKFINEEVSSADVSARAIKGMVERLTRSFLPGAPGALRVSSNVEGAEVQVAGRPAGVTTAAGLLLRDLAPGSYEIRVARGGYRPWAQTVAISSGETTYVDAQLEQVPGVEPEVLPATIPATQPAVAPAPSRTGWKAAFWIGALVTVGMGGGIVGAGLTTLNKEEDKEAAILQYVSDGGNPDQMGVGQQACDTARARNGALEQGVIGACDEGDKFALLTNVFIGLTAAAGVATSFFLYKAYIQKSSPEAPAEPAEARRPRGVDWAIAPSVGPRGGSLGLFLRF